MRKTQNHAQATASPHRMLISIRLLQSKNRYTRSPLQN